MRLSASFRFVFVWIQDLYKKSSSVSCSSAKSIVGFEKERWEGGGGAGEFQNIWNKVKKWLSGSLVISEVLGAQLSG